MRRRHVPFSKTVRDVEQILERAADALLMVSVHERGYGDHPFHTARWETRTAARESAACGAYDAEPTNYVRSPWADVTAILGARLRLAPQERVIVALLAQGHSPSKVREMLGLPDQEVRLLMRRLVRAVRRLGLTTKDLRPKQTEVEQTFREQMTITVYHGERHCPEGQEACRRYGKCTRRWYLRLAEE